MRESKFLCVKKTQKRAKNRFTHTFGFHVEKKNTEGKRGKTKRLKEGKVGDRQGWKDKAKSNVWYGTAKLAGMAFYVLRNKPSA